jgi:hypothetical protein
VKSTLIAGALSIAALAVVPAVHSPNGPDRPPGVAKDAWISINERLGFVLAPSPTAPSRLDPQVLLLPGGGP